MCSFILIYSGIVYVTMSKTSEAALAQEEMNQRMLPGHPKPMKVNKFSFGNCYRTVPNVFIQYSNTCSFLGRFHGTVLSVEDNVAHNMIKVQPITFITIGNHCCRERCWKSERWKRRRNVAQDFCESPKDRHWRRTWRILQGKMAQLLGQLHLHS